MGREKQGKCKYVKISLSIYTPSKAFYILYASMAKGGKEESGLKNDFTLKLSPAPGLMIFRHTCMREWVFYLSAHQ